MKDYVQSRTSEAVIRLTYAFAVVGKVIGADVSKERLCSHPSPECTTVIMNELLAMDYEFGINDPSEMAGEKLRFYRSTNEKVLLAHGMTVDALEVFNGKEGPSVYRLLSYTTGRQPTVLVSSVRPADQRFVLHSI